MGRFFALMTICLALAVPIPAAGGQPADLRPTLTRTEGLIRAAQIKLDHELSWAARRLSQTGLVGPQAEKVLADLTWRRPDVLDAAILDAAARIVTGGPASTLGVGQDRGQIEHVRLARQTGRPASAPLSPLAPGAPTLGLAYPVVTTNGASGYLDVLIRSQIWLGETLTTPPSGRDMAIWVLPADGWILFHTNANLAGRNLFQDPSYRAFPEMQAVASRMVGAATGQGEFEYLGLGVQVLGRHEVVWSSLNWLSAVWRIVVGRPIPEPAGAAEKKVPGVCSPWVGTLESLARDPLLTQALIAGDQNLAQIALNRYGMVAPQAQLGVVPAPASLSDEIVDFDKRARQMEGLINSLLEEQQAKDKMATGTRTQVKGWEEAVRSVAGGKSTELRLPLLKGPDKVIIFSPVYDQQRFLGLVYSITMDPESPGWMK